MTTEPNKLTRAEAIELGRLQLTIEGRGYQGEGWVRLADGWLSVRGTLPGETVVVDVDERSGWGRRIWGDLVRVVVASGRRSDPHCDRVAWCHGCHLRHIAVIDELTFKTETIAECIEKYGELDVAHQPEVETIAVAGATRADAFRVRTNLTIRHDEAGWDTGLTSGDRLVPMRDCPALADSARRTVERFDAALERFPPPGGACLRGARIAAPVPGHGYVDLEVDTDDGWEPLLELLDESLPPDFGLAVSASGRRRRHVRGPARFRLPMADLRLEVGFDDWFHATIEPAEVLYDTIMGWLDGVGSERALDAGCGIGTIGLLCADRGASVVGFDVNRASIETAELNAMSNDLDVQFRCGGWERALRDLVLADERFDTVVINPMRDPLGDRALAYVPRLDARRVLYLGPSAAPASKDVATLRRLGFEVTRLGAANLHPATYHVMLVGLLERGR